MQGYPSGYITQPLITGSWVENHFQTRYMNCEERIRQLSVTPGKKGKRCYAEWSHREEGPGSQCLINLAIQWVILCFAHKPTLYEDGNSINLSTINE